MTPSPQEMQMRPPVEHLQGELQRFDIEDTSRQLWVQRKDGGEELWRHVGMRTDTINGNPVDLMVLEGKPFPDEKGKLLVPQKAYLPEVAESRHETIRARRLAAAVNAAGPISVKTEIAYEPQPPVPQSIESSQPKAVDESLWYDPDSFENMRIPKREVSASASAVSAEAQSQNEFEGNLTVRQQRIFGAQPERYEDDQQSLRWRTTEESKRDSFSALLRAVGVDEKLDALVKSLTPEGIKLDGMVDLIRTDKTIRLRLAEYLSKKLDAVPLLRLPERVATNSSGNLKNPNSPGYEKMTSREYATLLALAMIDGTFKNASAQYDKITTKDGYVTTGQHRAAAQLILYEDPDRFGKQAPF